MSSKGRSSLCSKKHLCDLFLMKSHNSFSDFLDEVGSYISRELNSRIVTIWLNDVLGSSPPTDTSDWIMQEEKQHILLCHIYAGKLKFTIDTVKKADETLKRKIRKTTDDPNAIYNYSNSLLTLSNKDSLVFREDRALMTIEIPQSQHKIGVFNINECWDWYKWKSIPDIKRKLGSPFMVRIPLPTIEGEIFGYCIFHPKELTVIEENVELLKSFPNLIATNLTRILYFHRLQKYRKLFEGLDNLVKKPGHDEFLKEAAILIRDAIGAAGTSIFLTDEFIKDDQIERALVLRATTAETPYLYCEAGYNPFVPRDQQILKVANQRDIYFLLKENSLTTAVYNENHPIIEYDVQCSRFTKIKFLELDPDTMHISFIGVPFKDLSGMTVGVIRCINRQKDEMLSYFFRRKDIEYLQCVVPVIAALYFERNLISHFHHDYTPRPFNETLVILDAIEDREEKIISMVNNIKYERNKVRNQINLIHLRITAMNIENISSNEIYAAPYNLFEDILVPVLDILENDSDKIRKGLVFDTKFSQANEYWEFKHKYHLVLDPTLTRLAIYNIIRNAIKYSFNQRRIYFEFAYNESAEEVSFDIINEGIGISREEVTKIFQKFYRAENARASYIKGTGLGLFQAHRALKELQNIELIAEASAGLTTTFRITFKKERIEPKLTESRRYL